MFTEKYNFSQVIKQESIFIWYTAVLAITLIFIFSKAGDYIENQLAYKIQFLLREKMGAAPDIDPRIKVYALDDYAVDQLKYVDIPLLDWTLLIETLSKSSPKMIIIDKKFGLLTDKFSLPRFKQVLGRSSPILVGAYSRPWERNGQFLQDTLINLARPEFQLASYLTAGATAPLAFPILDHRVYGPSRDIESHFSRIGHINYDHMGKIEAFRRISDAQAIPHLSLLAANKLALSAKQMWIDDTAVYWDRKGLLAVNFPAVNKLYEQTKSIFPLINLAQKGRTSTKIQKDDIVIILPLFYTGNSDMVQTPLGRLPGGFVIVSLVNSILNKQWLRPLNWSWQFCLIGTSLGALSGLMLTPLWFWLSMLALTALIFTANLLLFCFGGILSPWLTFIISLLVAGIIFFSLKMSRQSRMSQAYENALSGLVSHKSLKKLIKNPKALTREASEQLITIMFLDMVSFSHMAENEHPKVIFSRLKDTFGFFSEKVHAFGGVVDKTLGDGMLCFFGYSYIDGSTSQDHADQAIACAASIQKDYVKRSLERHPQGEAFVPLRVGINSAKVYIGDLGDQERIDFTLIGDGVNFAQRLEAACDPFHILLSEAALQLANLFHRHSPGMSQKKIKIKHHEELFDVFEYQPLHDDRPLLEQAKTAFYSKHKNAGRSPRWPVLDPALVYLDSPLGEAKLLNFSLSGFAVAFDKKLEAGETLAVRVASKQEKIKQHLQKAYLPLIICELRWVTVERGQQLLGLKIINLSENEKMLIYDCLRNVVIKII